MKTYAFATNIHCGGCVATVSPVLNNEPRIASWKVATSDPQKILTVTTNQLSAAEVQEIVAAAGFRARLL